MAQPQLKATLFYGAQFHTALSEVRDRISCALAGLEIQTDTKYADREHVVSSVGGLTLTAALSKTPVDIRQVQDAIGPEPGSTCISRPMYDQLTAHRAALVIGVTGPCAAAAPETQRAICMVAVGAALEVSSPELIHWSASNILYRLPEFLRRSALHVKPRPDMPLGSNTQRSSSILLEPA